MTIGIVGAGAIGTIFGASLARARAVRLLVRDAATAQPIAHCGGLVIGEATPVRVEVSHEPERLADCGLVIVAVKAYATVDALAPLREILRPDAIVVSIQNGIDAAAHIETALGRERRIAVGTTTEAGRLVRAGEVVRASRGATILGWARDASGDRASLAAIAQLFTASDLATSAVDDSTPHLWAKLVVNAALNPITALARVTNGELLERPALLERSLDIAREVATLAAGEGIVLPFDDAVQRVRSVALATASNRSSMLQDIERGRPTEIDAILGAVIARADVHGLAVPASRAAYDEVRRLTNA